MCSIHIFSTDQQLRTVKILIVVILGIDTKYLCDHNGLSLKIMLTGKFIIKATLYSINWNIVMLILFIHSYLADDQLLKNCLSR